MNREAHPLCSVIITCFQREKYIESSVLSVYNQTYRPIECIVINDGSTDNTWDKLLTLKEEISGRNDFELVIRSTENKGACAARNLGFSISSGVYIQNLDSDDILHPKKLEFQINALNEHPNSKSAWAPLKRFEDHEEDFIIENLANEFIEVQAEENPFIPQFISSAGLHRREVFENAGLWTESLSRWQDFEYQVRVMAIVDKYVQFDDAMYFFRQHNNGRINDMFSIAKGVNAGFAAMLSLESHLSRDQKSIQAVRKVLRDSYASLFKTAILNSLTDESLKALKFCLKWGSTLQYKVKIYILFLLIKFLPLSVSKLILRLRKFL